MQAAVVPLLEGEEEPVLRWADVAAVYLHSLVSFCVVPMVPRRYPLSHPR